MCLRHVGQRAFGELAVDVDREDPKVHVLLSHVPVNVRRLFAAVLTVRALKTRLLPALVLEVPRQTGLLAERAGAVRARKSLVLDGGIRVETWKKKTRKRIKRHRRGELAAELRRFGPG